MSHLGLTLVLLRVHLPGGAALGHLHVPVQVIPGHTGHLVTSPGVGSTDLV